MIKMWVLVVVVSSTDYRGGVAVVSQEFNSLETCQVAMKSIIEQTNQTDYTRVKSSGCYVK